jgi:hypothetical protein
VHRQDLREHGGRLYDRRAVLVVGCVLNELPLDLDLVEGISPEIAERAAPLAEIVERDADAELAQLVQLLERPEERRSKSCSPISSCSIDGSSLARASAAFTSCTNSVLSSCSEEALTETRMSFDQRTASAQAWQSTQRPMSRIAPERSAIERKSSASSGRWLDGTSGSALGSRSRVARAN